MTLTIMLVLVWLHFVADFVLQSDRVAVGKSGSNKILVEHVLIYSLPFVWFGWQFVAVNAVAHFATDYVTSRITSRLWKEQRRHGFFVVIGADQAIHLSTLFATYIWITP